MPQPQEKPLALVAATPQRNLESNLEFRAMGAYVDNFTAAWVELPDAQRFIPPNTFRVIPLPGVTKLSARFAAPPGVTQPLAGAGQTCYIVATELDVQPTGGPVGVTGLSASFLIEAFARANVPAAGNAGRLIRLTDYDRGVWLDDGTQFWSITGEVFNVAAWDARGDNVTDDLAAITSAIAAAAAVDNGTVYFPPGTYRTTASIALADGVNLLGAGRASSEIRPSAQTFAAVTATGTITFWTFKALSISYATATAGARATNSAAIGISLLASGAAYPYMFEIAQVIVSYAFNAFSAITTCRSFMYSLRHVYVAQSGGFAFVIKPTSGATTILLQNCYANAGDAGGFDIFGIDGLTLIDCACDNMTPTASEVNLFSTCRITMIGFQCEANTTIATGFGSVCHLLGCVGIVMNFKSVSNLLQTDAADEAYALRVSSASQIDIFSPTNSTDTSNGGGTSYIIVAAGATHCAVFGSSITAAAGTATDFGIYTANAKIAVWNTDSPIFPQALNAGAQIYPGSGVTALAQQSATGWLGGTGVPAAGVGNNGDFYIRSDGGAGTCIYQKRAGVWVATGA